MFERSSPLQGVWTFVLAVPLVIQLAGVGMSIAGEGPTTEPSPIIEPATPAPPPQPEESSPADMYLNEKITAIEQSVDEVHATLERDILEQAIRLDNFFGNVKSDNKRQTGYQLRWSNYVRVEQGGALKFGSSLRANIVLPKISERLRLSFSGENVPQPFAPSLPEDPGNPGFDRPSLTTKIVNTELRYEFFQTPSTDIFLGGGFRLVIPPEAFVRSRIQHTYHIADVALARVGETIFLNNTAGAGETTEVSLERSLSKKTLLRWANTGTTSQEIKGLEWGTDLSLIHELSSLSAITVAGSIFGNTSLDDVISNYRILARYRRNFLRSWLFYELEPEISWPRSGNGTFSSRFAITFLLEVVFRGTAAEKMKKSGMP